MTGRNDALIPLAFLLVPIAALLATGCAGDEADRPDGLPPDPAVRPASDVYARPYIIEDLDTPHGTVMCISLPNSGGMDCIPLGWDPTAADTVGGGG